MTSMGTSRKIAASVTLTLTNGVPSMLQNSLADLARRERIPTVVRHQDGPHRSICRTSPPDYWRNQA